MENLLKSLELFGANPETVGDNLFSFFSEITHMDWDTAIAAGSAIFALFKEADRVKNETTCDRLRSCMYPVRARLVKLIADAPEARRKDLLLAASQASLLSASLKL